MKKKNIFAVVTFPGSNCDRDCVKAVQSLGINTESVWHRSTSLEKYSAVILPGGFSYGDYLRAGAIARFSPIVNSVIEYARKGGLVIGICNGFQILVEAGLLPGALLKNNSLKFVCKYVKLICERTNTSFTSACKRELSLPIAHGQGRYYADNNELKKLEDSGGIVFRYASDNENCNGSINNIAGIINDTGNVMGMMPHPERSVTYLSGSIDGRSIFESMINALETKQ